VRAGADAGAGERRGDGVEGDRSGAVGQADRGAGEDASVHHPPVHPPLGQDQQRGRRHHGVGRRQQDRHREHPHGEEVPHQACLQVGDPRRGHDRDHAAAEQDQERHQVTRTPGCLRDHVAEQNQHGQRHRADVAAERPRKTPPGPVPHHDARKQAAGSR
jgi:hypothetical protein